MNGRGLGGRDFPGLQKAAEVIEPYDVAKAQCPTDALYPPVVIALPQHVPSIHGVSPALAGFGERIRRDTGDDLGIKIVVEAEKMRMGPDIGAVIAHEYGDIADDADAAGGTARAQRTPLLKKRKLQETPNVEFIPQLVAKPVQRIGLASRQFARPAVPALLVKTAAQGIEENKIFKPPGVVAAKNIIGGAAASGGAEQKFARGARQQRQLHFGDALEVDPVPGIGKLRDCSPGKSIHARRDGRARSAKRFRQRPRWRNRASCRSPPDSAAEPARATDGRRQGNR